MVKKYFNQICLILLVVSSIMLLFSYFSVVDSKEGWYILLQTFSFVSELSAIILCFLLVIRNKLSKKRMILPIVLFFLGLFITNIYDYSFVNDSISIISGFYDWGFLLLIVATFVVVLLYVLGYSVTQLLLCLLISLMVIYFISAINGSLFAVFEFGFSSFILLFVYYAYHQNEVVE